MMRTLTIAFAVLVVGMLSPQRVCAQREFGVAYLDADRLYDTLPSPFGYDADYTPDGRREWNTERYVRKVTDVAAILDSMAMPVVIVAGVENERVVRDIVSHCGCDYSYVHRTMNTRDGLDFALLYFADLFVPAVVSVDDASLVVEGSIGGVNYAFAGCAKDCRLGEIADRLRSGSGEVQIVAAGELTVPDIRRAGLRDASSAPERAGRGNEMVGGRWKLTRRVAVSGSLRAECEVYARRWLLDRRGAPAATFDGWVYRGGAGCRLPLCVKMRRIN